MTPDLSEFEALESRQGPVCNIGLALEAVEGQDLVNLTAALAGRTQRTAIAKWLHKRGIAKSVAVDSLAAAITRHRLGQCACRLRNVA